MKKVLVIYHREDNDGVCSAGIVQAWLTRYPVINNTVYRPEEFEFYGVNYADLSKDWTELMDASLKPNTRKPRMDKWEKFEHIFMVDISFNDYAAMHYMHMKFGDGFHWCDHHAPAIKAVDGAMESHIPGIRRTDQSALLNTWDYLSEQLTGKVERANSFIHMLSDYDSWAWVTMEDYKDPLKQENLFAFNTGITRRSNLKVSWFSTWIGYWLDEDSRYTDMSLDALDYGRIVYTLDKERTERALVHHGDTGWTILPNKQDSHPRKACVVITTDRFNSQSFARFRGTDITNGVVFKIDAANDKVIMSIYNVNDDDTFDCGVFCKDRYMGGGHKGAAGATLTRDGFMHMFISKTI